MLFITVKSCTGILILVHISLQLAKLDTHTTAGDFTCRERIVSKYHHTAGFIPSGLNRRLCYPWPIRCK